MTDNRKLALLLTLWIVFCIAAGIFVGLAVANGQSFNKADCIFPMRATATACQDQPCDFQSAEFGGSGDCVTYPSQGQVQSAAPAQPGTGFTDQQPQLQATTGF